MQYTYNIRSEYSWVPEEEYISARLKIMKGFLDRESLYHTAFFIQKYEAAARDNLKYEISLLEAEVNKGKVK